VLKRLQVELSLTLASEPSRPITLAVRELEDFHPDRIVAKAEVFAALRSTRRRLEDPRTFDEAAAELMALQPTPDTSPVPPPLDPEATAPQAETPTDLLDQILQQSSPTPAKQTPRPKPSREWGQFLERITAPLTVREHPRQAELIASVDAAMAHLLRDILHHPEFQALESLWRALDMLTRRLETGGQLTIELIDVTRGELEADLLSDKSIDELAAYKLLVDQSLGSQGGLPWTFLVADFRFDPTTRDIALLWRLGQLARLAGAPLLASAGPRFVGCESLAATSDPDDWHASVDSSWSDLRQSAEAPYLGLALPRFLLRAPYGRDSVVMDSFDFEEFTSSPPHEAYLWGNPAFALAVLLGMSFDEDGRFDPRRLERDLTDLPLPIERDPDGEVRAKPCAEVLLGNRAADCILATGLIPIQSVRDRDAVHLAGLVSIADPPSPLALG
jgi:type VI secretion system protein ImpC